jgi:hypothetical protein
MVSHQPCIDLHVSMSLDSHGPITLVGEVMTPIFAHEQALGESPLSVVQVNWMIPRHRFQGGGVAGRGVPPWVYCYEFATDRFSRVP